MVAAMNHPPSPDLRPVPAPRAIVYCRVSTSRQEEDGTSLDTQEAAGRAYCAERGYAVVAVFREVYSGAEFYSRKHLAEARRMLRDGEADVLVSYAIDRLSRRQSHVAIVADEVEVLPGNARSSASWAAREGELGGRNVAWSVEPCPARLGASAPKNAAPAIQATRRA